MLSFTRRAFSLEWSTRSTALCLVSTASTSSYGGNYPLIIWEGAADQLRGEHQAAETELDLGARQGDLDLAGEDPQ